MFCFQELRVGILEIHQDVWEYFSYTENNSSGFKNFTNTEISFEIVSRIQNMQYSIMGIYFEVLL